MATEREGRAGRKSGKRAAKAPAKARGRAALRSSALAARVAELEQQVRALQRDNAHLADGQADALLLGLVADHAHRADPAESIRAVLEPISVLKDIPVCALCAVEGDEVSIRTAFLAFAQDTLEGVQLAATARARDALARGALLDGEPCAELGLPRDGALASFRPTVALAVPFASPHLPAGVFLFVDDAAPSRLPEATPVLQRAVGTIIARLEASALVNELRALNTALDEKVAIRTRALRASEKRLRLALDAASMGTWEWNPAIGEVRWSSSAAALVGAAANVEPALDAYLARVHVEDRGAVRAAIELAQSDAASTTRRRVEHRVEVVPGELRWLELHARVVLGPEGRRRLVAGVVIDVTERHRLEEDLLQSQKMESVGRLAGGIAHDFNNLLTTILGVSEVLLSEVAPGEPLADDLRAIRDAGRHAAALTRQLLAFSRKQRLETRPVALEPLCRGFAPMLSRLIGEDVTVRLELAPDAPPVLADPAQLEQILLNLTLNARDAMPGGGTVTIEVAEVPPQDGRLREVRLSVADTGVGMTPEVAAQAFEPFFTTKGRGQGTGLGLATVYGIVKQHGGTVTVRSAPGEGARFDVLLPVAERAVPATPPPPPAKARGGTETLLVVDDEPLVRRALGRALERLGYTVLDAASGEEALSIVAARGGRVDLLLSDVVMPGMRGPELASAFRSHCPGRPVLLMSGYPEAHAAEALPLALEYLQKPITPEALAAAIRGALDRPALVA